MIHHLALIGDPPQSRTFTGTGVPPVIHEDARIEAFCTIDAGCEWATTVGRAWLMKGCHVGHDVRIGDGCELAPFVIIGGYATLEPDVQVGMGVIIRNRITIGEGARLGMGAVVTKDVPAGETWIGNPARKISQPEAADPDIGWHAGFPYSLGRDPQIDPLWDEWYESRDKPR